MNAADRSALVKRRALELAFDAVGIAPLEPSPHADALARWLAAGYAGTMTYLHRQAAKRADPRRIMPGARAAVVTLTNYCHAPPVPPGEREGRGSGPPHGAGERDRRRGGGHVAQYAWSADYHDVLGRRLERLAAAIREAAPGAATRAYVDAGPVPERDLAQRAGLGWIAKNTMLIHPGLGSFTFIGVVLTDADLATDLPFDADRCGTCTRCLDACPTHAFVAPRELDARACLSYLTIEHRGEFTPEQGALVADGGWVFGCDVCQDVCPWNVSFARATADPELAPRPDVATPDVRAFLAPDDAAFAVRFGETPFSRPGAAGMRRNARAVLAGRSRTPA